MEYLCYQQFSVGWESLEQVVVFQVLEVDMDVSQISRLPFPSALHVLNPLHGYIRASRET